MYNVSRLGIDYRNLVRISHEKALVSLSPIYAAEAHLVAFGLSCDFKSLIITFIHLYCVYDDLSTGASRSSQGFALFAPSLSLLFINLHVGVPIHPFTLQFIHSFISCFYDFVPALLLHCLAGS